MDLGSALIAMVSAVVVAGIGYATTKLTSSTQKKTAEVEARGPEWHAFLTMWGFGRGREIAPVRIEKE